MNDQTIYRICKALVDISNHEYSDYGYHVAVELANDFVATYEAIEDAKNDIDIKISKVSCVGDIHDAMDEAWDAIRKRIMKKYENI